MTNKPILYYIPQISPCQAVLLTAAELKLDLELRHINIRAREHRSPEFLKINPHATLPVLDDNGKILTESHVICIYLAEKYSTNEHFYPKNPDIRNEILTQLFYDCGNLNARLRKIIEPILVFGSTELSHEAIAFVNRAYEGLECSLKGQPYLCGQHMTVADLCCLSSMETANDYSPMNKDKFPNLQAWMERMSKLPYFQRCLRDGADMLKEKVFSMLEENRKAWV